MAKSYISSGATFNSEELITGLDQLQPWVEQIIRKSIKCALKNWNNPYREQKFTERHEVRPHFHYSTSVSRYRHSTNEPYPYPYHYLADVVIGVDMEPDEANLRSMLEILKTQTLNIELNLFTRAGEYLIFRSVEDSQKKITRIEPYTFLGQARVTDSGIEIIRESAQPSSSMAADETPDSHVSDYEAFLAGQLLECIPIGQKTIPAPIREKIAEIIQGHEPVISGFDANTQIALQVIFKFCNVGDAMLFNKEQTTPEEQSAILARVKAIVANLLKYNEEELTLLSEGTRPSAAIPAEPAKTKKFNPELFQAVTRGDIATVERLLDTGANPDACDARGRSLLMLAVQLQNPAMVKLLIDKNANLNLQTKNSQMTALMMAADHAAHSGYQNLEIFRMLLEAQANTRFVNIQGNNALQLLDSGPIPDDQTIRTQVMGLREVLLSFMKQQPVIKLNQVEGEIEEEAVQEADSYFMHSLLPSFVKRPATRAAAPMPSSSNNPLFFVPSILPTPTRTPTVATRAAPIASSSTSSTNDTFYIPSILPTTPQRASTAPRAFFQPPKASAPAEPTMAEKQRHFIQAINEDNSAYMLVALANDPELLDFVNTEGDTPLFHAAKLGRTSILNFLLSMNPDIFHRNNQGLLVWEAASIAEQQEVYERFDRLLGLNEISTLSY